ncbi:helix-turn-helix transcriptional regulator [Micromonospora rhizosphaerae]|uniref:helix-turn-helix transcriptional regulator n=1 Tax=Micromonospora rhizosphaerae TaxID=568872 RepID=UPI000B876E46|nr:LuxR family transcriptional regulator [Micromonospora rhizosphaerae]
MGRQAECAALDRLVEAVRAGESRSLVVRGEAGVGKSALLKHLFDQASGCRVVSAAGVRSEMELPFAALHQLCAPMLDLLDRLPEPQRDALSTAFRVRTGPAPDRFLVGLAVLSLFAAAAEDRPLVCVIDDAQWLDRASAQVLAFVARRLFAKSVACVFAVRNSGDVHELSGLPAVDVAGLGDRDARALLRSVIPGRLDEQVRDRIVAEARGNPLALLELRRELSDAELAGGFGSPTAQTLSGRIEDSFQRRLEPMPADTRQLLLLAAAEPLGDPALFWRAAQRLGGDVGVAAVTAADEMIDFGARVRFRHPLLRWAVYGAASPEERRRVHRALADATDVETDPDRCAWHRAHATAEPDEEVAAGLERSAVRAEVRGGVAATAAFLERAAALTPDSRRRAERALAAAQAKHLAGAPEAALALLAAAQAGPLDELRLAHVELLRGQIAITANRGNLAPRMLLNAARQLEPLDAAAARATYLQALASSMFTGRLAEAGDLREVVAAARAAPPAPVTPRAADLLLDALVLHFTEGPRLATPAMRQALRAFSSTDISVEEELHWLWLAYVIAVALWDDNACHVLAERHAHLARRAAALAVLPLGLSTHVMVLIFEGELAEAAALNEDLRMIIATTKSELTNYGAVMLAAWQGRIAEVGQLVRAAASEAGARGEGIGLTVCDWASAVLYNGLGRYEDARAAAQRASADPPAPGAAAHWAPTELVEAAVRSGDSQLASQALEQLVQTTQASQTDWALGIEARSRALLSQGEDAESLYRTAIDRLGRTRVRPELARSHLLYGEWLRRERRRMEAREQLRTAHEMFAAMGLEAFADRAARELLATGETVRRRTVGTCDQLTPQETQIARLARTGLTNKEIASHLYVSPRTVEWHLRKVFAKRGITSRKQLDRFP